MLSLWVRVQNFFAEGEEGQWYTGGGGFLGLLVAIAIILACAVFIWVNVDVNEK